MLSNSQNIRSPRNRPFNSAAGRQRQGTTYFLLLIGDASFLLLLLGVLLVVVRVGPGPLLGRVGASLVLLLPVLPATYKSVSIDSTAKQLDYKSK
jgi:hypothetical protein